MAEDGSRRDIRTWFTLLAALQVSSIGAGKNNLAYQTVSELVDVAPVP